MILYKLAEKCRKCLDRKSGCHDECEIYKKMNEMRKRIKTNKKNEGCFINKKYKGKKN